MPPNTRNKKKPTSGARASEKKKAYHAKHAPTIDPLKQAAERLGITHIYATATSTSPRYDKKCKKFLEEYISSLHDLLDQPHESSLGLIYFNLCNPDICRVVSYVPGGWEKLRPGNVRHWGLKKVMITRWGGS